MARYGVNKQIVVGNLGADAELVRVGENQTPKASFRVAATVRTGVDAAGVAREQTEWFTCILWGKLAEGLAPYLTKGKTVYVEGRTETRSWEDDGGETHYRTEVRVDQIVLLGGGRPSSTTADAEPAEVQAEEDPVEEIPF